MAMVIKPVTYANCYIYQYYKEILTGQVIVGKKVRTIYQWLYRMIRDGDRRKNNWYYDVDAVEQVVWFANNYCHHSKGPLANEPVKLELWQKAWLGAIYGVKDKRTGRRRFKETMLTLGRKNGKSLLVSILVLYELVKEEVGAEVYCCGTKLDAAKIVWGEACTMIRQSAELKLVCKITVAAVKYGLNSTLKPLAGDSKNLDGLNPNCAVIDEAHAINNDKLYNVISDGMAARQEPLLIIITTAGFGSESLFVKKSTEADAIFRDIAEGNDADVVYLPVIYQLDDVREVEDEAMWGKANPNLNVSKDIQFLREKVAQAQRSGDISNCLCKHFDVQATTTGTYMDFSELNNTVEFDIEEIRDRYVIGGFDLSKTNDLTVATLIFKKEVTGPMYVVQHGWLPEHNFEQHVTRDHAPYDKWERQGLITRCPGAVIDYKMVSGWFKGMCSTYNLTLAKCGYDRWSATYLVQEMSNDYGGGVMEAVAQGAKTLSQPMMQIKGELINRNVVYNNSPLLKYCMCNVGIKTDDNGNIRPIKANGASGRIDAYMSLLDAYVVYLNNKEMYDNLI